MTSDRIKAWIREHQAGVWCVGLAAVLLGGLSAWQILSARSGPSKVVSIQRLESGGVTYLLVIREVEVALGDGWGGGEQWTEDILTLLDPNTGDLRAETRWPEDGDQPRCEALSAGKMRCSSRKVPGLVYSLPELEKLEELEHEVPFLGVGTCGGAWTDLGEVTIRNEPVAGTSRRQYSFKADGQTCLTEHEFIASEIVCDRETDTPLQIDDEPTALLLDHNNTIRDKQRPTLLAYRPDCGLRWEHGWPKGNLGDAIVFDGTLFVTIKALDPDEEHSLVEALNPVDGSTQWAVEF